MAIMNDTHPEAERYQIELIRNMTPERRAALASQMRNRTYWMARRAVAEAHPTMPEIEQKLLFIELNYGRDLAWRVRRNWREADAHA